MKASTQYTDMIGTVAADISDLTTQSNDLDQLAKWFKIDQTRFKVIGISIYGTEDFFVSFICVDNEKSTNAKEHIVKIRIDEDYEDILSLLFKRLHIVLYHKFDDKYPNLDYDEEANFSDYHDIEKEEE